jgi:hypothetical protein
LGGKRSKRRRSGGGEIYNGERRWKKTASEIRM